MPHVTFIHGIANKPPAEELRKFWVRALSEAVEPLSLSDQGVTSSLVYWADLLYPSPIAEISAFESALENTPESVDAAGGAVIPIARTVEEAKFLARMRAELTAMDDQELAARGDSDDMAMPAQPRGTLERVPLPWFLKRRIMATFLRDVHHYLFDVEFAPGNAKPVFIQKTIRQRFLEAVCAPTVSRPHVVVSHSMGTVIAYDCLMRVEGCAEVDGFITIGSPLGIDEVQDKLSPGWTRSDGFPHKQLRGPWINLFDRLDPVCGFDPVLANDFQHKGAPKVEDVEVQNPGLWRHSGTKYLRQPACSSALRRALAL